MIELELKYIANGIFNLSRRHQGGYMPERVCERSRAKHTEFHAYYDDVRVDAQWMPSSDGYSHLIIDVFVPEESERPGLDTVQLAFTFEYPALLTFRCTRGYTETLSLEGGVTEELRGVESGTLYWSQGEYVR